MGDLRDAADRCRAGEPESDDAYGRAGYARLLSTAQITAADASAAPVLLLTKLHAPSLREGHVRRPQLVDELRSAKRGRVALVLAPAGGGKTSLLAE